MKRLGLIALLVLSACSLRPWSELSRITVELRGSAPVEPLGWVRALAGAPDRALRDAFLPQHYYCVGLNVMGQGIPAGSRFGSASPPLEQILAATTSCSYEGAFSGWQRVELGTTSVELSVNVPTGPERVVQVAGTGEVVSVDCPTVSTDPQGGLQVFELGRTRTSIFGETAVTVAAHPNPTTFRMNCAGSSGVSPDSVTNLVYWYHAAAARFPSGVSDGAVITSNWTGAFPPESFPLNVSGSPTYHSTGGPNGMPYVYFPTGAWFILDGASNAALTAVDAFTLYVVASTTNGSGGHRFVCLTGAIGDCLSSDPDQRLHTYSTSGPDYRAAIQFQNGWSRSLETTETFFQASNSSWAVYEFVFSNAQAQMAIFRNELSTTASMQTSGTVVATDLSDQLVIGQNGGYPSLAKIAEVLFYSRNLNAAESAGIKQHLRQKYGI